MIFIHNNNVKYYYFSPETVTYVSCLVDGSLIPNGYLGAHPPIYLLPFVGLVDTALLLLALGGGGKQS